jgi:hypothetical protein
MLKLEANSADVATIDSIITAVYDGISGPAGKKRDWDRERSLYIPGARLIPTAMKAGTENMDLAPHILDIEGFIARVEPFFEESGFYEKEIARRTEQFGQMAHVWSTYESRHNEEILSHLCAGSTASSYSTMAGAGGSSRFTGSRKMQEHQFRKSICRGQTELVPSSSGFPFFC